MNDDECKAVARPSRVAIALKLASTGRKIINFKGDPGNFERQMLAEVEVFLESGTPHTKAALESAERGCAHAFGGSQSEARLEAWLCAAVAELLRGAA